MNKKGFTLIEVLVVFAILALISGLAVVSYRSFFGLATDDYYNSIESNITMAGSEYFKDNRGKLPVANNYSEVSLNELIERKYIEPVKDSKGNNTCTGRAFVYKEEGNYKYESCIVCEDYESSGSFCDDVPDPKYINISAITILSRQEYNPNVSYANALSANNENVVVKFNMVNAEVLKYKIINVNTGSRYDCMANSANYCEKEIDTSGSYYVTAYDNNGKILVNNQQMSVKIFRSGIDFSITGVNGEYTLNSTACSGSKKVNVSFNIERNNSTTEFYKKIEYKVMRIKNDGTKEEAYSKVITALNDSFSIGSGHYQIEVTITNEADVKLTKKSTEFDVVYNVLLNYGDVINEEFKVIKDYPYNLPTHVNAYNTTNLEVKWYKGTTRIYPTTIVTENCKHTINGEVAIAVDIPSKLTDYCKNNLVYNGSEQTLTNNPPTNVTFKDNVQTNAGSYTVKAHINSPQYIWSDGTFDDKEFTCNIGKATNPITVTTPQTWSETFSTSAKTKTITAASNAQGTVTYAIQSQPSGSYFSISGRTVTMKASTPAGTYAVVVRATAAGNDNYSEGYKDITLNVTVSKATNPITVTTPQTWSVSLSNEILSTSAKTKTITAASNAQGTVSYAIKSQVRGTTTVDRFSISGTTLTMKTGTGAGTYTVVITATAAGNNNYNSESKDITMTVTVSITDIWFYWGPYQTYENCVSVELEGKTNCQRKCEFYFSNITSSSAYSCSTSTTKRQGKGVYCWCHSNTPITYNTRDTSENKIKDKYVTGPACCTQGATGTTCCPDGGVYYFPYCYKNNHGTNEVGCGLEPDGTHYYMGGKCYFERYVAKGCSS